MRPPPLRAKREGVFPEGQPLLHDQGHTAMLSYLGNMEETLVAVPGSRIESFKSSQNADDRCLSHSYLKQKSDKWMHLSPIYTRMYGEWLRYTKSTSQYSLAFSLKVRDDWGSQVNPLISSQYNS